MIACSAGSSHRPLNLTIEQHHVLPQAFQHLVAPSSVPAFLFDRRTVPLCPTHHRNVHAHIVRLMKTTGTTVAECRALAPGRTNEYAIACQALVRWLADPSRTLQMLRDARLFGEA